LDLLREAIAQFARAALEPVAPGEAVERLEQPA
jgi:hypothetical protein